jgi:hypothetical protein
MCSFVSFAGNTNFPGFAARLIVEMKRRGKDMKVVNTTGDRATLSYTGNRQVSFYCCCVFLVFSDTFEKVLQWLATHCIQLPITSMCQRRNTMKLDPVFA